jgi:hypothetical protein
VVGGVHVLYTKGDASGRVAWDASAHQQSTHILKHRKRWVLYGVSLGACVGGGARAVHPRWVFPGVSAGMPALYCQGGCSRACLLG